MIKVLEKLYNEKVILDHGMHVGTELANVLSGGDTTIEKVLSEDDLYKLELDSFMRLVETKQTQERIKHIKFCCSSKTYTSLCKFKIIAQF